MKRVARLFCIVIFSVVFLLSAATLYSKDDFAKPKEFGIYVKTEKGLTRLTPNIVFDEKGLLYIEMNNPPRFLLKNVEFFVNFRGDYRFAAGTGC